ncbi:sugar phosphate isomerase/epimerase family protein [Anaerocolumna sp. MB42-C2]|uniref:sugar phosphate isomerase/epimerase family protein n=1 Tax=Anaerocolumna sp. MB42-C2 TaxID=3070997 RepID=UPI0027E016AD|nr:TIM barrel protein [Anaerocolumna sp. MB42-C2]WMJ90120.1 TIM barrel protein [Anaerocolumna sp. MB42-C2]
MDYQIGRSVSLYSYQQEYYEGKLDLEGCIREAAKAGATGIELLPEQMMDDFPVVTPEFKEKWFGWMEKYKTEPTCYDAFLENHIYDNRTLTIREQVDMMNRDIKIAQELGFKTLRTLVATPLDVIEGSLACAEENNIKVCIEVHSPFSLNSGWADGYMEMILRTGTKHFGFMPDFGIFCRQIPAQLRSQAFRLGASKEGVKIVDDAFSNRVEKGFTKIKYDLNLGLAHQAYMKANGFPELMEALKKANANQADFNYAMESFGYTWNDPKDIIDNIQYIYHTHAKCYDLTEDYNEPSIPVKEVVKAYKKAGYHGFLSTEYEGNRMLNDALPVDSIEQVRRHQEVLRRAIEE